MKTLILLLLTSFFVVNMTGCSNKLSRSKAKSLIIEDRQYPIPEYGKISKKHYDYKETRGAVLGRPLEEETREMLEYYTSLGIIEVEEKREEKWLNLGGYYLRIHMKVNIRDEYKKYIYEEDNYSFYVKFCDIIFHEITGLRIFNEDNNATVEYQEKRDNWTPFGKYFKDDKAQKINKSASMALYDDGWRIQ